MGALGKSSYPRYSSEGEKTFLGTGTFWCLFIKCMVCFVQMSTQPRCILLPVLKDHELFPLGVSWGDRDMDSLLGF